MIKKAVIPFFPVWFKWFAPFFLLVSIRLYFVSYPVWGSILLAFSIILFTTEYVTKIDLRKRHYADYLFFLGLRLNLDESDFDRPLKIVITKENQSTMVVQQASVRQMDWTDFNGILFFETGKPLTLSSRHKKSELIKDLKEYALFLDVYVEDQTTSETWVIDLSRY